MVRLPRVLIGFVLVALRRQALLVLRQEHTQLVCRKLGHRPAVHPPGHLHDGVKGRRLRARRDVCVCVCVCVCHREVHACVLSAAAA
jgi:hypothetical protein